MAYSFETLYNGTNKLRFLHVYMLKYEQTPITITPLLYWGYVFNSMLEKVSKIEVKIIGFHGDQSTSDTQVSKFIFVEHFLNNTHKKCVQL